MATETTAITAVKQEVRLQEWLAQIEAQQASGLTVRQWCLENGIVYAAQTGFSLKYP